MKYPVLWKANKNFTADHAYKIGRFPGIYSFKGIKIVLDYANGSAWNIAKAVFEALDAKTYMINSEPNGTNINKEAEYTH